MPWLSMGLADKAFEQMLDILFAFGIDSLHSHQFGAPLARRGTAGIFFCWTYSAQRRRRESLGFSGFGLFSWARVVSRVGRVVRSF